MANVGYARASTVDHLEPNETVRTTMANVGYARASTVDQDLSIQIQC